MNDRLFSYIDACTTPFQAVAHTAAMLREAGYAELTESAEWQLEAGRGYYVTRNGSSLIAFRMPEGAVCGFMMTASHCDTPCFKIKENAELAGNGYVQLSTEKYGGMICSTWMDRPLSVAGRVLVRTETGVETRLVDLREPVALIPNVAIHMNRQVNDGYKWNPAVDLLPLLGGKDAKGKLNTLLEEMAGGRILGHDLYLYVRQSACVWGMEEEFLSSAALDDLECAWGCTQGFLNAKESESIPVLCVFDAEEVGSGSVQGAASTLLPDVLKRICGSLKLDLARLLANSFMVSADNAHAIHPNHPEFADPTNAPVMGSGIVVKFNSSLSYCTDGVSAALFRKACSKAGAKTQSYYNRADLPGGSTLGRISLGKISIPTVDIGLPQLAMHSCYETAAVADAIALEEAMAAYYGCTLEFSENGFQLK